MDIVYFFYFAVHIPCKLFWFRAERFPPKNASQYIIFKQTHHQRNAKKLHHLASPIDFHLSQRYPLSPIYHFAIPPGDILMSPTSSSSAQPRAEYLDPSFPTTRAREKRARERKAALAGSEWDAFRAKSTTTLCCTSLLIPRARERKP